MGTARGARPRVRGAMRGAASACAALVVGVSLAVAGGADARSAPTPSPTCRPGWSVTTVPTPPHTSTHPSSSGHPTTKPTTPATPTLAPGVHCIPVKPTPFPARSIAPEDTIGGVGLAGAGLLVNASPGVPTPPAIDAVSLLVADADSGEILLARAPHALLRPASTLKILTAITVIPKLKPTAVITATTEDMEANGTRIGMIPGEKYTVADLLTAMLVLSANDAAYGLADAFGGYDQTLAAMNATAADLGAYDTVAKDPSGLDEDGQMSSAYDLALIARAGLRMPAFRSYVKVRLASFPAGKDEEGKVKPPFTFSTINTFLEKYPGAIGIKTGRTDRAKHTFVGAATRGGKTYLVVWMGALSADWKPTGELLDWTFRYAGQLTPVGALVEPGTATRPAVNGGGATPGTPTPSSGSTPVPSGSTPASSVNAGGRTVGGGAGPGTGSGDSGQALANASSQGSSVAWWWGGLAGLAVVGGATLVGRARRTRAR